MTTDGIAGLRLARLKSMPELYRKTYQRAIDGTSKAAALKAKCQDCCNWQRKEVEHCAAADCPLWPYRPYAKHPTTGKRRRKPPSGKADNRQTPPGG